MSNSNPADHTNYCTQQVMHGDRERFLSAMLAPQANRAALMALLAWNMEIAKVGEITSEEMIGLIRYQWWRDALDEIYSGKSPRQHAVVIELAEAINTHDLPQALFLEIIAAREADMDRAPFATLEALDTYALQTGGTLQKLWLHVLGVDDAESMEAAEHIGAAWALIGSLRACHHAAHLGKVRLPADELTAAGINADVILQEGFTPPVSDAVQAVAELAEEHLRDARACKKAVDKRAFSALSLAVQSEDFLKRLKHAAYNPATPAVEKGRATRAFKLWRANLGKHY